MPGMIKMLLPNESFEFDGIKVTNIDSRRCTLNLQGPRQLKGDSGVIIKEKGQAIPISHRDDKEAAVDELIAQARSQLHTGDTFEIRGAMDTFSPTIDSIAWYWRLGLEGPLFRNTIAELEAEDDMHASLTYFPIARVRA